MNECSRAKRALECGGALPLFDSPECPMSKEIRTMKPD